MCLSDPVTIFMVLRGSSALAVTGRAAKSSCPFCSPAHEIISVLFRAGTVTPHHLGHCGITPLNVLCLKVENKPGLSGDRSAVHLTLGFPAHFSASVASGKLPAAQWCL